eukprot:10093532-Alexandrium_andersonii.AAC.1
MYASRVRICPKQHNGTEFTPRERRGPVSRPFLGPRSSGSECLKQCCAFVRADCGLRRIAALMGLARIADCTSGTLQ